MSDVEAGALVVGGGPAGLFLAGMLARELTLRSPSADPPRVILLEKGPRPGRKLLASGGGQCNITNRGSVADFIPRYGEKTRFMRGCLHRFTNEDLLEWFAARGLECAAEASGKIFPASRRASDVLEVLVAECRKAGVLIEVSSPVRGIAQDEDGFFSVDAAKPHRGTLIAIACGGKSYQLTGSEGDGYVLAAAFGHRIVAPRPALTALRVADFSLADLAGLSFENRQLSQWRTGRRLRAWVGDVLITHEGLSGPGILDASRYIEAGDWLEIDFSGLGREAFRQTFTQRLRETPKMLVKNMMADLGLPRRLADRFRELAGIGDATTASTLRRESREAFITSATGCKLHVASLVGWERAMVTAGGIDLAQVDPATMESRIVKGLYFAGEVLDIDGDTGGFNLQAAFSTAAIAARAMAGSLTPRHDSLALPN